MISNYYSYVCIKIILTFLLVLFHTEISQSQVFEKFLKLNDSLDKKINYICKKLNGEGSLPPFQKFNFKLDGNNLIILPN